MIEDSQEAVKKSRSPHKRSISNKTKSPLVEDSRTPLLEVSNVSKGKLGSLGVAFELKDIK